MRLWAQWWAVLQGSVDGTDRWMGAIPGAVMGAAVGEFGQQVYDKATNSAYAPWMLRGVPRIANEAAFSAIGWRVDRRYVLRPVAYAKPPPSVRNNRTSLHGPAPDPVHPDQITGSSFHSFLRSVADNRIFSETTMQTFYKDQNAAIRGW